MNHLKHLLLTLFVFISSLGLYADEGMWIPTLLEAVEDDMQSMGLKLTADDIYSINHSSLKDAVVRFGRGCTAEIVSTEGLIFTNHHCSYSAIQALSSMDNNYLEDGYWAMSREEELPSEGLTVTRIVRIEDVTSRVFQGVTDNMTDDERAQQIGANAYLIQEEAMVGNHYEAVVQPFYYGNEYYMIVTEVFSDIRFVGAPPSSIGKYGFDTDNWVWPRHTGDFSVFRIYADQNNNPAEYSEDNVPYEPLHHFPVSLEDQNEGDFTMVYGFPGTTEQYLTSFAVDYRVNIENPAKIEMRDASLAILWADMQADDEVKLQYAARQSSISNAWKKWKGENKGLEALGAIEIKQELEAKFQEKVNGNSAWKASYGTLLDQFEQMYSEQEKYSLGWAYYSELVNYGPTFIRYVKGFENLLENYSDWDDETLDAEVARLQKGVPNYFKNYNLSTDQKVFTELFTLYLEGLDEELHPDIAETIDKKYKGSVADYANDLYANSYFVSEEKMTAILDGFSSGDAKKMKKDMAYLFMQSVYEASEVARSGYLPYYLQNEDLMRTYVKALKEVMPEEVIWPDANGTLRIAYGKIEGSYPRDGMKYLYYTTLDGVMDKYIPGDPEFDLPQKLIDLYDEKDYGQYAQNGELRVCFTASNHTTGGNSGSPVLDAYGNLIGINFDRSWESTMSDVLYDPNKCRNIVVDIRYVLFIIDKFAGASHLIDELTLVTEETRAETHKQNLRDWIVVLTDSLRETPKDYSLFNERGKAYSELGMYQEALTDFSSVLKEDSKNYDALLNKGKIYSSMKLNLEAVKEFNLLIKYYKDDKDAYFNRGLAYTDLGKYRDAVTDFGKVIGYDPTNHRAYYNRGVCYHMLGNMEEGCDDMKMAYSLGGEEEGYMYRVVCD